MARGIEELAEMQVTGPVQGGDMVAKPNEMPVGAAALLNKMQKKSTPGIFKLPTPDKEMPDFMKVAAEGVEEETQIASGDTYNIMAGELLREGFNSDYIKSLDPITLHQLYEETFGSVTDDMSQVDPTDWRTILKMIESGMTPAQIEEQLAMNEVKDDLHMKAAAVEEYAPEDHQLAYITPDESNILQLIGGSGETNPMTGIQQFPQYGGATGTSKDDEKDTAYGGMTSREASGRDQPWTDKGRENVERMVREAASDAAVQRDIERGGTQQPGLVEDVRETIIREGGTGGGGAGVGDEIGGDSIVQNLINKINNSKTTKEAQKFVSEGFGIGSDIGSAIWNGISSRAKKLFGGGDDKEETTEDGETRENKQFQTFLKNILMPGATFLGGMGKSFGTLKMTPEKLLDPNYLAIMKDTLTGGRLDKFKEKYGDIIASAYGPRGGTEAFETALAGAVAPEGSEAQRRTAPWEYYDQKRLAAVGGNPEKIASIRITPDMKKNQSDFVDKILAAREQVGRDRDRDQGGRGGGGRGTSEIIEDVAEVTTTDPRAGAFGVGGTMPYTHDTRTAGAQMDVPLGRRFEIDKAGKFRGGTGMSADEAYKYATLGGYSQLEPFQEYLARRRKHLGEEKPRYFDEEGNVIFSDMETT